MTEELDEIQCMKCGGSVEHSIKEARSYIFLLPQEPWNQSGLGFDNAFFLSSFSTVLYLTNRFTWQSYSAFHGEKKRIIHLSGFACGHPAYYVLL